MVITMVAAVAQNGAIGRQGVLPWRDPEDLADFRAYTLDKTVIVGSTTWRSMPRLSERHFLVMTRERTPEQLLARALSAEVVIAGGQRVYERFLPLADHLRLTVLDMDVPDADRFFPAFDYQQWDVRQLDRRIVLYTRRARP